MLDYVISNCNSESVSLNYFPVVRIDVYHPFLEIHLKVNCVINKIYKPSNEFKNTIITIQIT